MNLPFKIKKLKSGKFLVYATTEEAKEFGEDREYENDRSAYWGLMWRYKAMAEANLETEDEKMYKDAPNWVKAGVGHGIYTQVQNHKNDPSLDANMLFSTPCSEWAAFNENNLLASFQIGSTCKKGDIHFVPSNRKELFEQEALYWDKHGFEVESWQKCNETGGINFVLSIKNGQFKKPVEYLAKPPKSYGRGEWTAETLEDAKQMCIDYLTNLEG